MILVVPTPAQVEWWAGRDGCTQRYVEIGGPEEGPDVVPCPALVAYDAGLIHVAYRLDEIEVAHLARGGTLWLTTRAVLPVHHIEVQPSRIAHATDTGEEGGL